MVYLLKLSNTQTRQQKIKQKVPLHTQTTVASFAVILAAWPMQSCNRVWEYNVVRCDSHTLFIVSSLPQSLCDVRLRLHESRASHCQSEVIGCSIYCTLDPAEHSFLCAPCVKEQLWKRLGPDSCVKSTHFNAEWNIWLSSWFWSIFDACWSLPLKNKVVGKASWNIF